MFGNFSFKTPSLEWVSISNSSVSLFNLYILSYLLSKTMCCLSGCLVSSASVQKLFCGIFSVFKWSFDEFVGEKVVSPSYSSAILGLPPGIEVSSYLKIIEHLCLCQGNLPLFYKREREIMLILSYCVSHPRFVIFISGTSLLSESPPSEIRKLKLSLVK